MQIALIFISKVLHINLVLKVIVFGTRNWPIGFPKAWFPFDPLDCLDYPSCIKKVQDKQMLGRLVIQYNRLHGLKDWRCMVISDISGSDNGKSPPTQPKGKTDPFPKRKSK